VARTSAWARRILSAQMGSWSELRHDTILYADQSYSVGVICEFPDAYVEPYPELFARLGQAAALGSRVVEQLRATAGTGIPRAVFERPQRYFAKAHETYAVLERIARRERRGERLTRMDLAFINHMIDSKTVSAGCSSETVYDGWYKDLHYTADILDPDLSIADVHSSPTEGNLHVGKSYPRAVVITVDDRTGTRAFVGAAYSFHQVVTGDRLTDSQWRRVAHEQPDVPWVVPIVAHAKSGPRGAPRESTNSSDLELESLPGGGVDEICRIDPGACPR